MRVDALCRWLRDGDTPGLVERVDIEPIEPPFPRFDRFERMPTSVSRGRAVAKNANGARIT